MLRRRDRMPMRILLAVLLLACTCARCIQPATCKPNCAFVELLTGSSQSPEWYVSHCWGVPAPSFWSSFFIVQFSLVSITTMGLSLWLFAGTDEELRCWCGGTGLCLCGLRDCSRLKASTRPGVADHGDWRSIAGFVNFLLRLPTGFGPTEHLWHFLLVRLPVGL